MLRQLMPSCIKLLLKLLSLLLKLPHLPFQLLILLCDSYNREIHNAAYKSKHVEILSDIG